MTIFNHRGNNTTKPVIRVICSIMYTRYMHVNTNIQDLPNLYNNRDNAAIFLYLMILQSVKNTIITTAYVLAWKTLLQLLNMKF